MSNRKYHRIILFGCLLICCLMLAEVYVLPLKTSVEVVCQLEVLEEHSRRKTFYSYRIWTDQNKYTVTESFYAGIQELDTITVHKSILTTTPVAMSLQKGDLIYSYLVAFNRARLGVLLTPLVITGILVLLLIYDKLQQAKGKRNLVFLLLICTSILFSYHIDLDLF